MDNPVNNCLYLFAGLSDKKANTMTKDLQTTAYLFRYIKRCTQKVITKLNLNGYDSYIYMETLASTLIDILMMQEHDDETVVISFFDWGVFCDEPLCKGLQAKMKITFKYKDENSGFWFDCVHAELITDKKCAMTEKDFE